MGEFMKRFLSQLSNDTSINCLGFTVLSPIFKKSTWAEMKVRYDLYGLISFFMMFIHILLVKLGNACLAFRSPFGQPSLGMVLDQYSLPQVETSDVNGVEFQKYLRENVDVLISVACPKILKKATLNSPRLTCLNYHTGALPKYRGRQPLFWALLNGEEQVGVTIHEMAMGLDAGDIVVQEMVDVKGVTSLHEMYQRTIAVGPSLLVEALRKIVAGDSTRIENDDGKASKYKFPTREDGLVFRAKGLSIY